MYTICLPGTHRGQKSAPNPLELELEMVASHHVCSEAQTQVPWESSQGSAVDPSLAPASDLFKP